MTIVLALVASGCAEQRARQRLTDEIGRSVDRSADRVLAGYLVVTLRPDRMPGGQAVPPDMQRGTLGAFGVALNRRAGRAALLGPGDPPSPLVVYDPSAIFARRVVKSKIDRRVWSRLDLDRLPDASLPTFEDIIRGAQPGDAVVASPLFLTDLLKGVLTGSSRLRKVDADGNRRVTFNFSVNKADRALRRNDDERKSRRRLLRALAITGDIGPGEVVLRKDGSLKRARFTFVERPDKQTRINLEVALDLAPVDQPLAMSLRSPTRAASVRVPAFGALRSSLTEELRLLAKPPTGSGASG